MEDISPKFVWQHMRSVTKLLKIYQKILQQKNCENRLKFDRIMAVSLVCSFLALHVCLCVSCADAKTDELIEMPCEEWMNSDGPKNMYYLYV